MSQQERWDIVVRVLDGPLSGLGDQVFRGPVVRIGANPGPGGMGLTGYRGLDPRQCVITAYTGGSVSVAAVGTNQVRVAPHANVSWADIDPITGPVYLSEGNAMHLGPVGRGATLEFLECRRLGMWQEGRLASEVADVQVGGGPPVALDAHRIGTVRTSRAPVWFVGCLSLVGTSAAMAIVLIGAFMFLQRPVEPLGPIEDGYAFYDSVDLTTAEVDASLFDGLQRPFYDFVMKQNMEAAGAAQRGLDEPETWDHVFLTAVTASVEKHVRAWSVFRRLDAVKTHYASVVLALRKAGLPEVFAALPYTESRYAADATSRYCAQGYWQFMPETALRAERIGGLDFKVRDCRIRGSQARWSPTLLAPPPNRRLDYVDDEGCLIENCDVDDRTDLEKSTRAAMFVLGEAWKDQTIQRSGAAVQVTILTHNAGYDDARYGQRKTSNIKPALERWLQQHGKDQGPLFYGANITCRSHADEGRCGSVLPAETQHYAYTVVAQHLLAVCYYAKNYGEDQAFRSWVPHVIGDGYCQRFKIPPRSEVQSRRGS